MIAKTMLQLETVRIFRVESIDEKACNTYPNHGRVTLIIGLFPKKSYIVVYKTMNTH